MTLTWLQIFLLNDAARVNACLFSHLVCAPVNSNLNVSAPGSVTHFTRSGLTGPHIICGWPQLLPRHHAQRKEALCVKP